MASRIDREFTETSKYARGRIASLQKTAGNLDGATETLGAMLAENREPIRDFTNTGLYELSSLLTEARDLIVVLNRLTTEVQRDPARFIRSEEHTSELQSLMRNSYAVFCLKKIKIHNTSTQHHRQNSTENIAS